MEKNKAFDEKLFKYAEKEMEIRNKCTAACRLINPVAPQKVAQVLPDMIESLKQLIYIIECNRATNGVSLDIMYQTEYWKANNVLKQATEQ